jgi:hypothetical protein
MKITASLYAAALRCAAVRDVRYYLVGVRVEPLATGGALLVATDGHRLLALFDQAATGVPAGGLIVPTVKVPAKDAKPGAMLEFDGARVTMESGASLPASYIDGRYPDWRAIVPHLTDSDKPVSAVNPALLDGFDGVNRAFGMKYEGIELRAKGPACAALVRFLDNPNALGVVMPVRGDMKEPGWMLSAPVVPVAA